MVAERMGVVSVGYKEGPDPEEVRNMGGNSPAPTCSTCGSILSGYEWGKDVRTLMYFCPQCRGVHAEPARLTANKEEIAGVELKKAA